MDNSSDVEILLDSSTASSSTPSVRNGRQPPRIPTRSLTSTDSTGSSTPEDGSSMIRVPLGNFEVDTLKRSRPSSKVSSSVQSGWSDGPPRKRSVDRAASVSVNLEMSDSPERDMSSQDVLTVEISGDEGDFRQRMFKKNVTTPTVSPGSGSPSTDCNGEPEYLIECIRRFDGRRFEVSWVGYEGGDTMEPPTHLHNLAPKFDEQRRAAMLRYHLTNNKEGFVAPVVIDRVSPTVANDIALSIRKRNNIKELTFDPRRGIYKIRYYVSWSDRSQEALLNPAEAVRLLANAKVNGKCGLCLSHYEEYEGR